MKKPAKKKDVRRIVLGTGWRLVTVGEGGWYHSREDDGDEFIRHCISIDKRRDPHMNSRSYRRVRLVLEVLGGKR